MVALIWLVSSVGHLVMYQIPFLYKGLLIFDKLIWIIPSVFYLVPYQIIFQYKGFLTVAILIWFCPSMYYLVSYQITFFGKVFLTMGVLIWLIKSMCNFMCYNSVQRTFTMGAMMGFRVNTSLHLRYLGINRDKRLQFSDFIEASLLEWAFTIIELPQWSLKIRVLHLYLHS